MLDFIYANFYTIFAISMFTLGAVYIGAELQTAGEDRQRQQRRSQAAKKGWATRRARNG